MTKEKFDRLANQMCEIPITSYEVLCKIIYHVYEKAIFEPTFGDIYAELCMRLSQKAKQNPFVHIIQSDEEPPTEDGVVGEGNGESSSNIVFRWTNDVDTEDAELVGPFNTEEECVEAATDADICPEPTKRDDMELTLVSIKIRRGIFIKIMRAKDESDKLYTVFFPVTKSKAIGQTYSRIFLSQVECEKDGDKCNSFRGILLNKCEDEFMKQNIYDGWKQEKKEYDVKKNSLPDREKLEKEEELEFRRIKIKKQVLGNIQFIGALYKKDMLKARIMRYCIESLLKLEELENGHFKDTKEKMDEEDHEAVCKLFTTIGSTIDNGKNRQCIMAYFEKIEKMSNDDDNLNSRSRFMYKDLIELRRNRWVARREEEKAKTLDEIKRDFERDERKAAQQSQQLNNNYRGGGGGRNNHSRGQGRGQGDYRGDHRDQFSGNKSRSQREKQEVQVDQDGFQQVGRGGNVPVKSSIPSSTPKILSRKSSKETKSKPSQQQTVATASGPAPLTKEKLEARVKSIKNEFIESDDVKELLLSMDELKTTPAGGKTMVEINLDASLDCKDKEREGIYTMFKALFRNGKLSPQDIQDPLGGIIEFLGSFVVDCPKAIQYISDLVADFIVLKALDLGWYIEQVKKLVEFDGHLVPGLLELTILSLIVRLGLDEVKTVVNKYDSNLTELLGKEKWIEIKTNNNL